MYGEEISAAEPNRPSHPGRLAAMQQQQQQDEHTGMEKKQKSKQFAFLERSFLLLQLAIDLVKDLLHLLEAVVTVDVHFEHAGVRTDRQGKKASRKQIRRRHASEGETESARPTRAPLRAARTCAHAAPPFALPPALASGYRDGVDGPGWIGWIAWMRAFRSFCI